MLNENYYNKLTNKYFVPQECNKTSCLTVSIILDNYKERNVYFNFPKNYDLKEIINLLYENFSKQIFMNYADITDYSVGDRLKKTGEKGKNIYVISEIKGGYYTLMKEKDENKTIKPAITFDKLKRNYTQIQQNTRNSTLSKFDDYFKEINTYGFLPTHFSKKTVLIAGQTMWNNLKKKDCIPTIYLPNTRENEQTIKKSIEALGDCIAYVTPKYDVCYEEILKKNIAVDTIIVCDADLCSVPQIIQDQSKYDYKLIVLSNDEKATAPTKTTFWNWHREEIDLLEDKKTNSLDITEIQDDNLEHLIRHFEDCIEYVSNFEIPIKLNSYGYYLRIALNAVQEEQFDYLLMRLKSNKELERNEGGYENFADKNPKEALKNIICYLKKHNPKQAELKQVISNAAKNSLIVADREDADFLRTTRSNKCRIVTNAELKKLLKNNEIRNKTIIFYSFNGTKDFDAVYNLPNDVQLVLYKQEKELYLSQLQAYTKRLEAELTSENRLVLCGLKYEPIIEPEVKVSPTLEQIIERLDQRSNTAYDGYKNESDSLLDDLEEEINYEMTMSNGEIWEIQSNETVFDHKGNLIKAYKLQENCKIRIYPKDLAENLIEIAIAEEPEIFGKVEEHSSLWKNALKALDEKYANREKLYSLLKEKGLRVLPGTVDGYFRGNRKFPMFNTDLKAILDLSNNLDVFTQIKKSKKLYNSTTIALGRGIKQELKQFLQQKTLGEILIKKQFSKETLQKFIDEKMPLLTITKIEEVSDEQ